jgi:hypothetical protein
MRAAQWRPVRDRFFLNLPSPQPAGLADAVREDWRDSKPLDFLTMGWKTWISGGPKS